MTTLRSEDDVDEEIRKVCAMRKIIGLPPLRGSSVYRAWNPGPRGTGLTIWRRSAAASFPRFGNQASRHGAIDLALTISSLASSATRGRLSRNEPVAGTMGSSYSFSIDREAL